MGESFHLPPSDRPHPTVAEDDVRGVLRLDTVVDHTTVYTYHILVSLGE